MTQTRTFGRRAAPGMVRAAARTERAPSPQAEMAEMEISSLAAPSSVDEELQAWKRERRRAWRFPLQPFLLVASLSFFIASFVLPGSVNGTVDWLLDILSVISAIAWLRGRRRRTSED